MRRSRSQPLEEGLGLARAQGVEKRRALTEATPLGDRPIKAKLVLLGHTHVQVNEQVGDIRVVNPGSVGQPRDGVRPLGILRADRVGVRRPQEDRVRRPNHRKED